MSTISVNNIESILKHLIERLRKNNITEISFRENEYWSIPNEEMDCMPSEPSLTVGSLSDDISFLNSLVEENYSTNYLELERLAVLLRFIYRNVK